MHLANLQLIISLKNFNHALNLLGLIALYGMLIAPVQSWAQPADSTSNTARTVDAVCSKQMVVLGELPSHGESKAFQAKAQIVKQLVNRCGFDAILFEAPIYDFLGFQSAAAKGKAVSAQLDNAIGRFWLTRELSDWRQWLYTQATHGRLALGGIDDQVSVTSDYAPCPAQTCIYLTPSAKRSQVRASRHAEPLLALRCQPAL